MKDYWGPFKSIVWPCLEPTLPSLGSFGVKKMGGRSGSSGAQTWQSLAKPSPEAPIVGVRSCALWAVTRRMLEGGSFEVIGGTSHSHKAAVRASI